MSEVYEHPEIDPLVDEEGNRIATEGAPPPEPVRKGVAGSAAAAGVLLLAWVLTEVGIEMPLEVQGAVAVLVGVVVAYLKSEY